MMHTLKAAVSVPGSENFGGKKQMKLNWNLEYEPHCIFIEISLRAECMVALKLLMVP